MLYAGYFQRPYIVLRRSFLLIKVNQIVFYNTTDRHYRRFSVLAVSHTSSRMSFTCQSFQNVGTPKPDDVNDEERKTVIDDDEQTKKTTSYGRCSPDCPLAIFRNTVMQLLLWNVACRVLHVNRFVAHVPYLRDVTGHRYAFFVDTDSLELHIQLRFVCKNFGTFVCKNWQT